MEKTDLCWQSDVYAFQYAVYVGHDWKRNINNFRYADHTTPVAESEEELKSLLMKVKEESEEVGLKLNIQKSKIIASSPITSWQIDREIMETEKDFITLRGGRAQNHCRW